MGKGETIGASIMAWLVKEWHWPAASIFAACFLLLLAPLWGSMAGMGLAIVYLQMPLYMFHQGEEHIGDRFRLYINRRVGKGREALTPIATFWINALSVWGLNLAALYLATFVDLSFGLAGVYLTLINGIGHIGQALAFREYNPGLWTSLVLFVPVGAWGLYELGPLVTWKAHVLGIAVAVAVQAAIIGYILRRARHLSRISN